MADFLNFQVAASLGGPSVYSDDFVSVFLQEGGPAEAAGGDFLQSEEDIGARLMVTPVEEKDFVTRRCLLSSSLVYGAEGTIL